MIANIRKINYTNNYEVIKNSNFIDDIYISFKVEQVPINLNPLDYWRFKRTIKCNIAGNIVGFFKAANYLVFLYTKQKFLRDQKPVLLDKMKFLKSLIKDTITSEIWIINDKHFLCIGIIEGAPIFIRSFTSVHDINDNIQIMITSLSSFFIAQSIRFFNCNPNDFNCCNLNVFQYSEEFMYTAMDGQGSLEDYLKNRKINNTFDYKTALYGSINLGGFILSIIIIIVQYKLNKVINNIKQELVSINYTDLPKERHYEAIKKLQNV